MKYRLIASLVLAAGLAGVAYVTSGSVLTTPAAAPAPNADDASLKSLRIE